MLSLLFDPHSPKREFPGCPRHPDRVSGPWRPQEVRRGACVGPREGLGWDGQERARETKRKGEESELPWTGLKIRVKSHLPNP